MDRATSARSKINVEFEKFENLPIYPCMSTISNPTHDPVPLSQEKSRMHPYSLPPRFHAFVVTTEPSEYKKIN